MNSGCHLFQGRDLLVPPLAGLLGPQLGQGILEPEETAVPAPKPGHASFVPPNQAARISPLFGLNTVEAWQLRKGRSSKKIYSLTGSVIITLSLLNFF